MGTDTNEEAQLSFNEEKKNDCTQHTTNKQQPNEQAEKTNNIEPRKSYNKSKNYEIYISNMTSLSLSLSQRCLAKVSSFSSK